MTAPAFGEALAALSRAMNRLDRPWMVIGGLAVIIHGAPRSTLDADVTVTGIGLAVEDLLAALTAEGFAMRVANALDLARKAHVLIVRHEGSDIPVDISLAWLPFEHEALGRAKTREFAGVELPFVQPEDLLVYKLVAARPRDLDDAERLLLLHGTTMDLARVERLVDAFCEVLEDDSRRQQLADLRRRVGL
jgi:Nucleotidyl transferase of unknown function (DUF2204)